MMFHSLKKRLVKNLRPLHKKPSLTNPKTAMRRTNQRRKRRTERRRRRRKVR